MKVFSLIMLPAALSFATWGCGSLGDSDDAVEDAKEGTLNIIRGVDIVGKDWVSECADSQLLDTSGRIQYELGADDVTKTWALYSDDECTELAARISYHGEYKLAEDAKDREDYRQVDFNYQKATALIVTEAGSELLSAIDFCGQQTWPLNEEFDLTENTTTAGCPLPNLPTDNFDLVLVEDDKMYFGNPGLDQAVQSEERPEEVDKSTAYVASSSLF